MTMELFRRVAAAAAGPGTRSERAQVAAGLIREAAGERWVGIYTVTDTVVTNEAWSGSRPPAFPTFPREKGLTAHALRALAPALGNDVVNDPRYLANQDDSGSELIVPVVRAGRVVGTLDVESNELGAFGSATIAHHQRCAEALKALWEGLEES